jgi:hypothetical protein
MFAWYVRLSSLTSDASGSEAGLLSREDVRLESLTYGAYFTASIFS